MVEKWLLIQNYTGPLQVVSQYMLYLITGGTWELTVLLNDRWSLNADGTLAGLWSSLHSIDERFFSKYKITTYCQKI